MDFGQFMCELLSRPPTNETVGMYEELLKMDEENRTKMAIIKMLQEDTGAHLLDSGGAYGRGYDKAKAFGSEIEKWDNIPYIRWDSGCFYKSAYKFLVEHLVYMPEKDKEFHEYAKEYPNDDWTKISKRYVKDVLDRESIVENTCNGDELLDKTLLFVSTGLEGHSASSYDGDYILLRTHNGCDLRGGYSTPHVFSLDIEEFLCDINNLDIYCSVCDTSFYSDDCGYHMYVSDSGSTYTTENFYLERDEKQYYDDNCLCPICGSPIDIAGSDKKEINFMKWKNFVRKNYQKGILTATIIDNMRMSEAKKRFLLSLYEGEAKNEAEK